MLTRPGFYREIWDSGELVRVASQCESMRELAEHFGVTASAMEHGMARLRGAGLPVPNAFDLLGTARVQPRIKRDEWSEDTHPGRPPVAEDPLDDLEETRLRRQIHELEARVKDLSNQLLNTRDMLGLEREARQHRVEPLIIRERSSGLREGASLVMLSDNHIEETVTRESINGLNEHNPTIARARMARVFEGARWLTQHARQSHLVRDVVLCLLGDGITGTIHEDLSETNALSTPEAVALLIELDSAGIRHFLADPDVEIVRVVCTVGNHGRLTKKMRIHTRIETNIEMLVYLSLAREFANEPRVKFSLPAGAFTYFEVFGKTIRATHGDSFKYSGALGGITNPINRGIARLNQGRHADLTIMGHFHQYQDGGHWIVNGSSIGYGPFSEWIHAPYERPQQAWALLDAKRWRSLSAPIWVDESGGAQEAA